MTRLVADSGWHHDRRAAQVGSAARSRCEALLHQLPRVQQVGALA